MAFHRIKKYSRQIVCQDLVLSCQSNHIEEIPLLRRAQVSTLSLRNQKARSGPERPAWLERDLEFSSMLMCWHLWNSRSVPSFPTKKRVENQRRTGTEKRERACHPSLTLRDQMLYTATEKYLLFLMPRETRRRRVIDLSDQFSSRRDRIRLSALYVDTALGLCQYRVENTRSLQSEGALWKYSSRRWTKDQQNDQPASLSLSSERMYFPCQSNASCRSKALYQTSVSTTNVQQEIFASFEGVTSKSNPIPLLTQSNPLKSKQQGIQDLSQSRMQRDRRFRNRLRCLQRRNLSLYCPSVLLSPDIQYIAQSGLMSLDGCLTLELS